VGDTTGKKVGRSDESLQFRRFFRHDPDEARFGGGPDKDVNPSNRDNYEESSDSFQQANDTIARYKIEQHVMAPYLFRAFPQRAMFDHAMALQREGEFGEVCRNVWADAFTSWTTRFGTLPLDCEELGEPVHLEVSATELAAMRQEEDAAGKTDFKRMSVWIGKYQDQTNYPYWRIRSRLESEKDMSEAHRLLYDAEQALNKADPTAAISLYVEGMNKFEKILADYPQMKDEDETVEEAMLAVMGWQKALDYLEEEIPESFPLKDIWERHAGRRNNVKSEFDRRRRGM